jgi:Ca2+-binding RTX toxin-like protein
MTPVSYIPLSGVYVGLEAGTGYYGDAEGDTYLSIENVTGSNYGDWLYGNAGANVISGGKGNDLIDGRLGGDTLDGGDNIDTLSYASSSAAVQVDIGNNTAHGGEATGDVISGFENLWGSAYDDLLYGSSGDNVLEGRGGNDCIYGGAGNDRILGNRGADKMSGGSEADTFVFLDATESLPSSQADQILDFEFGVDKIDLTTIDADVYAAGDQAFQVVGDFTGVAGQLVIGPNVWGTAQTVKGDTNGDGISDFEIVVLVGQGAPLLNSGDLYL